MERWNRTDYFMFIANVVAMRSTCCRAKVGAVVVRENRIISCGYNGAPRGLAHCSPEICNDEVDHCRATVHAEANALLFAGQPKTQGADLYCTHLPCEPCTRLIINAGIVRVYYGIFYGDFATRIEILRMMAAAGIRIFPHALDFSLLQEFATNLVHTRLGPSPNEDWVPPSGGSDCSTGTPV